MICPFPEDMRLAAEWLYDNDATGETAERLKHVATWLRRYSDDNEVRRVARQVGCTVKYARNYMMRAQQEGRG